MLVLLRQQIEYTNKIDNKNNNNKNIASCDYTIYGTKLRKKGNGGEHINCPSNVI